MSNDIDIEALALAMALEEEAYVVIPVSS